MDQESYIGEYPSSPQFPRRGSTVSTQKMVEEEEEDSVDKKFEEPTMDVSLTRKWPTAWWWQLLVLIVRTFRQSRHVITSKLNCVQAILLAVVVSFVWFQVSDDTRSINDRYGYVSCHNHKGVVIMNCSENAVFFYHYLLELPAPYSVHLVT